MVGVGWFKDDNTIIRTKSYSRKGKNRLKYSKTNLLLSTKKITSTEIN